MTIKRLAAFVVAVALVVGALFLRDALDDNSDGNSDGSTATDGPTNSGGTYQLICSTEFTAVCESLDDEEVDVKIEPAGTTLDRLAKAADTELPDAWITLDPFPAMLDQTRTRGANPLPAAIKLSTPIGIASANVAVVDIKADALRTACAEESIATCAGRLTGSAWVGVGDDGNEDPVNLGIGDPSSEAVGLISFANGIAGLIGGTDIDDSRLAESDVRAWVRNTVTNSVVLDAISSPLDTLINRSSRVDIAFSTSQEVVSNPSGPREPYQVIAVEPAFQLHAVFAAIGDDDGDVRSQMASALEAAGWEKPGAVSTPLPAGTFINLRKLWEENN